MRIKSLRKVLAIMLVLCVTFSYTGIGKLALANETDISIGSEGDGSGSGTEESSGSGAGSESDNDADNGGYESETDSGSDMDGDTNKDADEEQDGDSDSDADADADDEQDTDVDQDTEPGTDDDQDTEPGTGSDTDDDNTAGNDTDIDPDPGQGTDPGDVIEDGGAGQVVPDNSDTLTELEPTIEDVGEYSLEVLRQMLIDGNTGYGSDYIDRILEGFSHDEEFLEAVYYAIAADPEYAMVFMNEMYELYGDMQVDYSLYSPASSYSSRQVTPSLRSFGRSLAAVDLEGDSKTASDKYIEELKKIVAGTDTFRHYDVQLSLKAEPELVTFNAVDIMLLFDIGSDDIRKLAENEIAAFAEKIFKDNNDSNIWVTSFSGSGVTVKDEAFKNSTDLVNYIKALQGGGSGSGSNLQEALIKAKYKLGVEDGKIVASGERKKVIIFYAADAYKKTYGNIYSDTWAVNDVDGKIINSIPISEGVLPEKGYKRWTYLDSNNKRISITGNIFTPGSGQNYNSHIEVTTLEAQYMVSQGIEIYTYAGTKDAKEYIADLEKMTYKMSRMPGNLRGGTKYEDYASGVSIEPISGRAFSNDISFTAFNDLIADKIISEMASALVVTDTLHRNFEVISENGNPITIADIKNAGGSIAVKNGLTVSLNDAENCQILTWNVHLDDNDKASIIYRVRVIDERVWGAGSTSEAISSLTKVRYFVDGGPKELTVGEPKTKIPPLVAGEAWIADVNGDVVLTRNADGTYVILAGDAAKLAGKITQGNGSYSYQWWYRTSSSGAWVLLTGANGSINEGIGIDLNIPLDKMHDILDTDVESYEYALAITDKVAVAAGYKNTDVISFLASEAYQESVIQANYLCKLKIVKPQLMIKVVDSNGETPRDFGRFETRVNGPLKNTSAGYWYFMGLDKKTYTSADGIVRGIYTAEAYVPYGYKVVDIVYNDGESVNAEIKLEDDGVNGWSCKAQTITITIAETNPDYYYDWAWPEDIKSDGSNSVLYALPLAITPWLCSKKRKGWFK